MTQEPPQDTWHLPAPGFTEAWADMGGEGSRGHSVGQVCM